MSLEGSWSFDVTHEGIVYKCRVDGRRIEITAPSGMTADARWGTSCLVDWTGYDGDIPGEELPDAVADEAEEQMRAMAEECS